MLNRVIYFLQKIFHKTYYNFLSQNSLMKSEVDGNREIGEKS